MVCRRVLRVSWEDFTGLDPTAEMKTSLLIMVRANVFDGLVERGPQGEIVPALATSWRPLDRDTWQFRLRQGVRFHTGEPFDAESVRYTFERLANSPQAFLWQQISTIDITDRHTVVLHTRGPFGPLLANLTIGAMIPPGARGLGERPIGTGPFKFVSYQPREALVLEANGDYWQGPPKLKEVIYHPCGNAEERAERLLAGELDLIFEVPTSHIDRVEAAAHLRIARIPGPDTPVISLNGRKEPYTDPRVRRAIHLAIDRRAIVHEVLRGEGLAARSVVSPPVFGHDAALREPLVDQFESRRLLAEAGWPAGFEAELVVPAGVFSQGEQIGDAVVAHLAQIGLRVQVSLLTEDVAWPRMAAGDFDLFLNGWSELTLDADYNLYRNFHSVSREGCQDPALDRLIEAARATLDIGQRQELYRQAQALILQAPHRVPLYHAVDIWAEGAHVRGFTPRPNRMIDLRQVSQEA